MSEKFVNLTYDKLELLFQKNEGLAAFSCKNDDIILSENSKKLNISSGVYDFFDFDEFLTRNGNTVQSSSVRTAIIINDKALVTSAICKIKEYNWSDFSLFSDFYSKTFERFGFIACLFRDDKIQYLLDINKFLEFIK